MYVTFGLLLQKLIAREKKFHESFILCSNFPYFPILQLSVGLSVSLHLSFLSAVLWAVCPCYRLTPTRPKLSRQNVFQIDRTPFPVYEPPAYIFLTFTPPSLNVEYYVNVPTSWQLQQMVTHNMLRTHEGKQIFAEEKIQFVTAFDLIKFLKQIK